MKKALAGSVFHTEETIKELRADRQFSVAYLKTALQELDDPNNRAAGLLALRDVAEAYGGLGMVAEQAGISREALDRSLSHQGQPDFEDPAGGAEVGRDAVIDGARSRACVGLHG